MPLPSLRTPVLTVNAHAWAILTFVSKEPRAPSRPLILHGSLNGAAVTQEPAALPRGDPQLYLVRGACAHRTIVSSPDRP